MHQRQPMKRIRALGCLEIVNAILRKYPRLHRYYRGDAAPRAYRIPPRPPAPSAIKALTERELRIAMETPDDPISAGKIALARKILTLWGETP